MKKRIHVNQHNIRANQKTGSRLPVITVKDYKNNTKCNRVDILDGSGSVVCSVIYSPDKPLACGARVWIETNAEIQTDQDQKKAKKSPGKG